MCKGHIYKGKCWGHIWAELVYRVTRDMRSLPTTVCLGGCKIVLGER